MTYLVQSVIFDKSKFSLENARIWLLENKYKDKGVDEKKKFWRFRQLNPLTIKRKGYTHYITKPLDASGIELIIAYKDKMEGAGKLNQIKKALFKHFKADEKLEKQTASTLTRVTKDADDLLHALIQHDKKDDKPQSQIKKSISKLNKNILFGKGVKEKSSIYSKDKMTEQEAKLYMSGIMTTGGALDASQDVAFRLKNSFKVGELRKMMRELLAEGRITVSSKEISKMKKDTIIDMIVQGQLATPPELPPTVALAKKYKLADLKREVLEHAGLGKLKKDDILKYIEKHQLWSVHAVAPEAQNISMTIEEKAEPDVLHLEASLPSGNPKLQMKGIKIGTREMPKEAVIEKQVIKVKGEKKVKKSKKLEGEVIIEEDITADQLPEFKIQEYMDKGYAKPDAVEAVMRDFKYDRKIMPLLSGKSIEDVTLPPKPLTAKENGDERERVYIAEKMEEAKKDPKLKALYLERQAELLENGAIGGFVPNLIRIMVFENFPFGKLNKAIKFLDDEVRGHTQSVIAKKVAEAPKVEEPPKVVAEKKAEATLDPYVDMKLTADEIAIMQKYNGADYRDKYKIVLKGLELMKDGRLPRFLYDPSGKFILYALIEGRMYVPIRGLIEGHLSMTVDPSTGKFTTKALEKASMDALASFNRNLKSDVKKKSVKDESEWGKESLTFPAGSWWVKGDEYDTLIDPFEIMHWKDKNWKGKKEVDFRDHRMSVYKVDQTYYSAVHMIEYNGGEVKSVAKFGQSLRNTKLFQIPEELALKIAGLDLDGSKYSNVGELIAEPNKLIKKVAKVIAKEKGVEYVTPLNWDDARKAEKAEKKASKK